MSQETPQPQPQPQQQQQSTLPNREADFIAFKNYAAYSFLVLSPVLIALPPRKLDHLTVLLAGAFGVSANHITRERTGRSIVERVESRIARNSNHRPAQLPSDKAQEMYEKVRAARERRMLEEGVPSEEMERLKARKEQDRGVLDRVWMGNEEKGWKERRLAEEQKALEEGKGYGDLIREHIWDVWTWGEKDGKDKKGSESEKKE
ncbi:hypothetical protein BDV18DRAFT_135606 [Aspergillus unguis]